MKSRTATTKKTTTVESAVQVKKSNTGRAPRYYFKLNKSTFKF